MEAQPLTAYFSTITVTQLKVVWSSVFIFTLYQTRSHLVRSRRHQYSLLLNLCPAIYTLWCFKEHRDKHPSDSDQLPVFLVLDWHFKRNNHWTSTEEAIFVCTEASVPAECETTKSHRGPSWVSMGFWWCGGVRRFAQKCHVYDCLWCFMPEMQSSYLWVPSADEMPLVVCFRCVKFTVAKGVRAA